MARSVARVFLLVVLGTAISTGFISSPVKAADSGAGEPSAPWAKRILERHRARHEFPGAVVALRSPTRGSFLTQAGVADPDHGAALDPDTPWIIGSATKTFVAVVVLQLAQEGKLDLNATIGPFFPDLPGASRITIRELLQHTSGINEYLDTDAVERDARRVWTPRELIAVAVARGPLGEPGAAYHYANTNYLLLGEIIEKVTSRPWYAEVRSRILEPLGLRHAGYSGEASAPRIGLGYVIEHGKFVEATERWHPSLGGAAGGMYSTTADLMAFTLALFEGNLLDSKRTAEMRAFVSGTRYGYVAQAYGLGLERYTVNELTVFGHMGTGSAHSSFIGYDPSSRAAVAVQINAANPGPTAVIGAEVLGEMAGKNTAPPPMPSTSVRYTSFPYRTLRRSDTGERIGQVHVASQEATVTYPVAANGGRTQLDLSLGYQRLQFDYRELTHPLESAQAITATAFLRQKLSDAWGLILVASPGYADDFKGKASLDAVTSTFVGAGSYRVRDDLEVGLGVAIQNVFGEPLPMPVGSVDWTISDRVRFRSILPINAELSWLPMSALGLRASVQVSGSNYHGAERVYGVNNPQLNYSAGMAELGARWFLLPYVHLTVHGGHTLFRRFEFSEGRDPVPGGKYELSNGMVFGADLGFGG